MKNAFHLLTQLNSIVVLICLGILIALCVIYRKGLTWYVKELIAMYSSRDTFFSKKRIESGIAFLFALVYSAVYCWKRIDTMDIWDFLMILGVWLGIAGYTMNHIQKEKKMELQAAPPPDLPKQ